MSTFLTFDGATRHDPDIDAWLDGQPAELGTIARSWFGVMRDCGDDVRELMHDGCPVACVADAPFCYVNVFTAHVNVGFYHGADLPDPTRLLQGTGKRMRHVKLKPEATVDSTALNLLIAHAYADIQARRAGRQWPTD